MIDTEAIDDSREQTKNQLKRLDYHIRSASTLGHILSQQTNDFVISSKEFIKGRRIDIVHTLLNHLAQCLVRTNREIVAVGLVRDDQIKVINQDAVVEDLSKPSQETAEERVWKRAQYAKNSINADFGASGIKSNELSNERTQGLLAFDDSQYNMMDDIYGCRIFFFEKTMRSERHPFPVHARRIFQLLQTSLKLRISALPGKLEAHNRQEARLNLHRYVVGMSLEKLDAQVKERAWAITKYGIGFRQFLSSEFNENQFHVLTTRPNWTSKLRKVFLDQVKYTEDIHLNFTTLEKKVEANNNFDLDLAQVIHRILQFAFKELLDDLESLRREYPVQESLIEAEREQQLLRFTKQLEDLVRLLLRLSAFVSVCETLLNLYGEAINASRRSASITVSGKRDKDEESGDWSASYINWIKKIPRQTRAAGLLTGLNVPHYAERVMKLKMDLLVAEQPDQEMEDWHETITQIYSRERKYSARGPDSNSSIPQKLQLHLQTLARNIPLSNNKDYQRLVDWKFDGAIHCEAIIACKNIVGLTKDSQSSQVKIGVSKRCCMVCAYVLQEMTKFRGGPLTISQLSVGFVGESKKMFPCALPAECPLKVAENVSERLDLLLQEKLKDSIPSLARKTETICRESPESTIESGGDLYYGDWEQYALPP